MAGARITGTAALELAAGGGRYALAGMCVGVGQGIAIALENIAAAEKPRSSPVGQATLAFVCACDVWASSAAISVTGIGRETR